MAPPCFGDLGKSTRDLFSKGFHIGVVKLDVKTVALEKDRLEIKLSGSHSQSTGRADGKVETKFRVCGDGGGAGKTHLTETFDTKGSLGAKLENEEGLLRGLKLTLDSNFNVINGDKDGALKAVYKHDWIHCQLESGSSLAKLQPIITAAAVLGCPAPRFEGFLGGANVQVDTGKRAVTKTNFALGYDTKDLQVICNVKDLLEFGGSVYHRLGADTELGVELMWTKGTAATRFGLAAKHRLDKDSHFNFTVDNHSLVKLGFTNAVRKGVKMTFSASLDGKAISGGEHRVGLGLDFDLS